LAALATRRLERKPVARILGVKEFWGLPLRLNDATLVPRPETETVVEAALAAIDSTGSRDRALRIADLGTGSGALLIALLTELPNAAGIGTDVSRDALAAARGNAGRLGVAARTEFAICDFGAALTGGFDLVVSNPPYIASADIGTLSPEVRHDPRSALVSTAIAPLQGRRRGCISLTAVWWSSLASVRNRRLPRCSARRGLYRRRHASIFWASHVRCRRVLPQ
jgi:release factor glutamine methyltransferase